VAGFVFGNTLAVEFVNLSFRYIGTLLERLMLF